MDGRGISLALVLSLALVGAQARAEDEGASGGVDSFDRSVPAWLRNKGKKGKAAPYKPSKSEGTPATSATGSSDGPPADAAPGDGSGADLAPERTPESGAAETGATSKPQEEGKPESKAGATSGDWASKTTTVSPLNLAQVRAAAEFDTLPSISASVITARLSWTPSYRLGDRFAVGGELGISAFGSAGTTVIGVAYGILARYTLDSTFAEAALGAESWVFMGTGTRTAISTGLGGGKYFEQKLLGKIDRIFGAYRLALFPGVTAHEIRLGVGVAL